MTGKRVAGLLGPWRGQAASPDRFCGFDFPVL